MYTQPYTVVVLAVVDLINNSINSIYYEQRLKLHNMDVTPGACPGGHSIDLLAKLSPISMDVLNLSPVWNSVEYVPRGLTQIAIRTDLSLLSLVHKLLYCAG